MAQSDLTRVVEPALDRLAAQMQYMLVDVELVREGASRYLRIYIDKPGGITLSDCEAYHRAAAPLVERVDYDFLEVCSPGLDRPLKKQRDYDAHVGQQVEIHLYRPVERQKQFDGELLGLQDGVVRIATADGAQRSFALKEIALCKPVIAFDEEDFEPDDALWETGSEEGEATDDRQE